MAHCGCFDRGLRGVDLAAHLGEARRAYGSPDARSALLVGLLAVALLGALSVLLLNSTSPYRDTAFQIGISREPEFGAAVDRMVDDNQAPGAQVLFWVGAQAGLDSITGQRALSIVLSSAAYAAALLFATGWRARTDGVLLKNPLLLVTTSAVILAPGVFAASSLVRYSSLAGAVWLAAFLLTVRVVGGEGHLVPTLGVVLGLGSLIAYSVVTAAVCTGAALMLVPTVRSTRTMLSFSKGLALGSLPTLLWLVYAGSEHVSNIVVREGEPRGSGLRALAGHFYEMGTWLLVGPSSLPDAIGIAVMVAIAVLAVLGFRRAGFGRTEITVFLVFTLAAVPINYAFNADSGWFMAGPAAIVALALAVSAGQLARHSGMVAAMLILATAAVAALPSAGVAVLRPDTYANQARRAVDRAAQLTSDGSAVYIVDEKTAALYAADAARSSDVVAVHATDFLLTNPPVPTQVVLILNDPGSVDDKAERHDLVRSALDAMGFSRQGPPVPVGEYDSRFVRDWLGITLGMPSTWWSCGPPLLTNSVVEASPPQFS